MTPEQKALGAMEGAELWGVEVNRFSGKLSVRPLLHILMDNRNRAVFGAPLTTVLICIVDSAAKLDSRLLKIQAEIAAERRRLLDGEIVPLPPQPEEPEVQRGKSVRINYESSRNYERKRQQKEYAERMKAAKRFMDDSEKKAG